MPAPPGESGFLGTGYIFEEKRKEDDSETAKYDKMAFKERLIYLLSALRFTVEEIPNYLAKHAKYRHFEREINLNL